MKVGIIQSNYLPWRGYFDLIDQVDLFVFHDDLQYTKNDWRNRNRILTCNGPVWLTIPCGSSEKRLICEVEIQDSKWQHRHWNQIKSHYSKSRHFDEIAPFFEEFYLGRSWNSLSELNQFLICEISKKFLGSSTEFLDSRDLNLSERKGERVLEILEKVDASSYLSGPAAKDYLRGSEFERRDIDLEWMNYSGYIEYEKVFEGDHGPLSIVDILFNLGEDAREFVFAKKSNE